MFLYFSAVQFDLHCPLSKSWPGWGLRLRPVAMLKSADDKLSLLKDLKFIEHSVLLEPKLVVKDGTVLVMTIFVALS